MYIPHMTPPQGGRGAQTPAPWPTQQRDQGREAYLAAETTNSNTLKGGKRGGRTTGRGPDDHDVANAGYLAGVGGREKGGEKTAPPTSVFLYHYVTLSISMSS